MTNKKIGKNIADWLFSWKQSWSKHFESGVLIHHHLPRAKQQLITIITLQCEVVECVGVLIDGGGDNLFLFD